MSLETSPHAFGQGAVPHGGRRHPRKASRQRISPENWVVLFLAGDLASFVLSSLLVEQLPIVAENAAGRARLIGSCVAVFIHFACAVLFGVYSRKRIFDFGGVAKKIVLAAALSIAFLLILAVLARVTDEALGRWFFIWIASNACLLFSYRRLGLLVLRKRLQAGAYMRKAASIGLSRPPLSPEAIAAATSHAVKIARTFELGSAFELPDAVNQAMCDEIDCIYVTAPWDETPDILHTLTHLRRFAAEIHLIAEERRICANRLRIGGFAGHVAITAVDRPLDGWGLWMKRAQDVVAASTLLFALAPLMIAIALAVSLESPGPVFFRQRRTGFNGHVFELWKFRSMYFEKSDYAATIQTGKDDQRVTRIGRIIRKTSLDELPQLLNVLLGDMSIVGPRPHALQTQAQGRALEELAEQYAARHRVRPGLTGWAQVKGCRGELDSVEKVRRRVAYDIEYIENWSTWFDIRIILRTILLVFHDPAAF